MAIAEPAIKITLDSEGNDSPAANNWGVQDNFFKQYKNSITAKFGSKYKTRQDIKTRVDAENILKIMFEVTGFSKIENQDAANFFFDTYFQNQSLYRALVCVLFYRKQEFGEMVNRQITLHQGLIDDINSSLGDLHILLGSALWLRRRMSRVFWDSHLWKGFDQHRFVRFSFRLYDAECFPNTLEGSLFFATELLMNRLTYMDKVKYPVKKYTDDQIFVMLKNTNLRLDGVETNDIYKIGSPFSYSSCKTVTNQTDTEDNIFTNILCFGIALFILKKL